ncbi:condensation domain-containing protein [Paenibacillus rhizoplanae]
MRGREDIVVGSPVAGRRHPDAERMIGMFVGTLAMRSRPAGSKRFDAYLAEVKAAVLGGDGESGLPVRGAGGEGGGTAGYEPQPAV